jgi:transcriptional regulator with XRE-family HTH domain
MVNLAKAVARNLKKMRGNRTQEAFARKCGISQPTLSQLERASQNVTIQTLNTIVRRLRCDPCDLFRD